MMLMLALLSGIAPLDALSSRHFCTMACCAGLPLHEAGSCGSTACHVNLSTSKLSTPTKVSSEATREINSEASEDPPAASHCEVNAKEMHHHSARATHNAPADETASNDRLHRKEDPSAQPQSIQNTSSQTSRHAMSIFKKPCQPDCGAGAAANPTNSNRNRDPAMLSYANRPRPQSKVPSLFTVYTSANTLRILCRQSRPRAPTLSLT